MPRIKRSVDLLPRIRHPELLARLVAELRESRESGQPLIEEQELPRTGNLSVTAIWDAWENIADDERAATILRAYEEVEGEAAREQITLAMGLTFPEAREDGRLSFQVVPILRKGDPVTLRQCEEAMIEEGASLLFAPDQPKLWFATRDDAEACIRRLVTRLPQSEQVWTIAEEAAPLQRRVLT